MTTAATAARLDRLAGGCGRPVDNGGDLLEGDAEHVVQHERHPLGRRKRLEDNQQRKAHGVRHDGLVLGLRTVVKADDRIGHVALEGALVASGP